ncbi:tryptophan halogenase family protein [Teredinibacter purpureus]|uniref:tryptophan halogenase family protein n=1 Tax=Teredinibacter purpureus TaxID=2731756 RepID=UPI0005F7C570|nr:tryptophan halogenase family protein [Teredinibacter purpureus]
MNTKPVQKVIIAGGGTAGWMAAMALSKVAGKVIDITLIESSEIGTVGVGEATIPTMIDFHNIMGIDEQEFMKLTNATFKLGINFVNWKEVGQSYFHSFGRVGQDTWLGTFNQYWKHGADNGYAGKLEDYSLETCAARQGKFGFPKGKRIGYSYHIDASAYAGFLKVIAENFGVKHINSKISDIQCDSETGHIKSLKLQDGAVLEADLYIDCTGFRSLLMQKTLQTGYEDWSKWLPCNKAVAIQTDDTSIFSPYTDVTAREAGWQWRIPLQSRTGNGHVYCDRYMDDETALKILRSNMTGNELTEPNVLSFTTGRSKLYWNKNCIALGLSGGFVEPLESTSIHMISRGILRLLQVFPFAGINKYDVDAYNESLKRETDCVRNFIIAHYKLTNRNDSDFWEYCRSMDIPTELHDRIERYREVGRVSALEDRNELFKEASWIQVLSGQGVEQMTHCRVAELMRENVNMAQLGMMRQSIEQTLSELPLHRDFVTEYCDVES